MLYWLGAYSLIAAIILAVDAVLIFICYIGFELKARLHIPVHTKATHLAHPPSDYSDLNTDACPPRECAERRASQRSTAMIYIKVQYDAYNRTFKLIDREAAGLLEDHGLYDVAIHAQIPENAGRAAGWPRSPPQFEYVFHW